MVSVAELVEHVVAKCSDGVILWTVDGDRLVMQLVEKHHLDEIVHEGARG